MLYINENPYANVTESSSYADKIKADRRTTDLSKALSLEQTRDVFELSGCSRIIPGTYTKFAVINWPAQDNKSEMHEVMAGYYKGEVSKQERSMPAVQMRRMCFIMTRIIIICQKKYMNCCRKPPKNMVKNMA